MAHVNEIERMAGLLASNPDYKVLRRMPANDIYIVPAKGGANLRIAIVDTETTGLMHETDKIIELGVVVLEVDPANGDSIDVIDAYQGFEDPGCPIPPEATAINGITDADVAGKSLDDERLRSMFTGVDLVIAHNAGFDRRFVEKRLPLFESMRWACSQTQIDWGAEGIGSAKLNYIAFQYGFFYEAHRAQTDCLALAKVLAGQLPMSGGTALAQLIATANVPVYRLWATNSPFDSKDAMKSRGYSWDASRRCWHRTVPKTTVKSEACWLRDNVYGGREVTIEFEALDATLLFSARGGAIARRQLPAALKAA
jgi:DNA polymerase III subunit epsilon